MEKTLKFKSFVKIRRFCRFSYAVRCYRFSCDIFECVSGNIVCCLNHPNPFGFNRARRVVREHG